MILAGSSSEGSVRQMQLYGKEIRIINIDSKGSFKSITHFDYDLTDFLKKDIGLFFIKAVPHLLSQKKHKELNVFSPTLPI